MSEFTCSNGHDMKSGQLYCPKCGGRLARMDGMTNRELKAQEAAELAGDDDDDNDTD